MKTNASEASSWGQRDSAADVRTLRRYQHILLRLSLAGEALFFVMLAGALISALWLFTQTNFENVIFYDGTDRTCVLNGKTEELIRVP